MNDNLTFSQRQKIEPVNNIIQVDSMNDELKTRLWNILTVLFWKKFGIWANNLWRQAEYSNKNDATFIKVLTLMENIYSGFLKLPIDKLHESPLEKNLQYIRSRYFDSSYNRIYDFIEFVSKNYADSATCEEFRRQCNIVLEEELSGYRFVNGIVCQISSEIEIEAISDAIKSGGMLAAVDEHISSALQKFSDRSKPDFRNSIKESISAVEALCRIITNKPDATLTEALKLLDSTIDIHPALIKSFISAYGYAGDEGGIRHALKENAKVSREDARYWLVTCSAFVNYLKEKSVMAGLLKS